MTVTNNTIVPIAIEDELRQSYMDYAMSVIVSRALPDVRDGLKPVQRRILFAMMEDGFEHNKAHKKSARVVGQVIYKYHPHGTDPIYGALVRLAQDFSMRDCLVDGHGNFGSMDGDKAAAMRYTEVRLTALAEHLLKDYDKETVDFQPNYDNSFELPSVLPAAFPNLLVNGASGIAVGVATNIPPHNLGEIMDACCALLRDPQRTDLGDIVKGPDFPTKGMILGTKGIAEAYRTGRGKFVLRGRCHFEELREGRTAIVVTEIPYQVNKSDLVQRIAELVNTKEIEGISDLRDESNRHGVRVVVELKRDAIPHVVLNRLYGMTSLQTSFSANMIALDKGRPIQMNLADILNRFMAFRLEVVTRRSQFFLRKAKERAQVLMALSIAVRFIDEVVAMIRSSKDSGQALDKLLAREWALDDELQFYVRAWGHSSENDGVYFLTEHQAKAILALRLQRLTQMEQGRLDGELKECHATILDLMALLQSPEKMNALMEKEFLAIKEQFATPRMTSIEHGVSDLNDEDLIPREDMVVTISVKGYVKRVPLTTYRSQKRGGRGKAAMSTRDEDEVSQIFIADTHTSVLVFTSLGQAYQIKVHQLPMGSATARGRPLISLFPVSEGESLATLLPLNQSSDDNPYIVFATSKGSVRKNALSDFLDIRSNGKIAMKLDDDEQLVAVHLANDNCDVLLSSYGGKSIRFPVASLRQFNSRSSTGVRGMTLKPDDMVVAMNIVQSRSYSPDMIALYRKKKYQDDDAPDLSDGMLSKEDMVSMAADEEFFLTISKGGFGKRTSSYAYRCSNRGGQGVATMDTTVRTGHIVDVMPVRDDDHVLLLTDKGQLLRCPVKDIRIAGRKTKGVKLFRLQTDESITSVAVLPADAEQDTDSEPSLPLADGQ